MIVAIDQKVRWARGFPICSIQLLPMQVCLWTGHTNAPQPLCDICLHCGVTRRANEVINIVYTRLSLVLRHKSDYTQTWEIAHTVCRMQEDGPWNELFITQKIKAVGLTLRAVQKANFYARHHKKAVGQKVGPDSNRQLPSLTTSETSGFYTQNLQDKVKWWQMSSYSNTDFSDHSFLIACC